jgi:response regulator RpfG family c-di-GMP phosphodiesterase
MDGTRVSVVVGVERPDLAERIQRIVDRDQDGHVTAVAGHPVATADLVRRLRPDVLVVTSIEKWSPSILTFIGGFLPPEQIVVIDDDAASRTRVHDHCTFLTVSDLDRSEAQGFLPPVLSRAYISSLRDKRKRDLDTIETLAGMAEAREASSPVSVSKSADLAISCLNRLDPTVAASEEVRYGFVLHDVGKLAIPESILRKPTRLDPQEWSLIERHPDLGVEIVKSLDLGAPALEVIRHHHERWDGTGYPSRLAGEEIPLAARVFSVADAYESMISPRPYRAAMSQVDALQIIKARSGELFDPEAVGALMTITVDDARDVESHEIDLTA